MPKRDNFLATFSILLFLSVLIFILSKTGVLDKPVSFLGSITAPVSQLSNNLLRGIVKVGENDEIKKLKEENLNLVKKLVDQKKLQSENEALHDQFQTENPKSLDLLPANIVGMRGFIPGVSAPESFIIDKGSKDGVKVGAAVVFKDNLVGKVVKTSDFLSSVILITNASSTFAAKTLSGVLGVIKGQGNGEIIFQNVLLSENLKKGDFILTIEIPPALLVGEIISVEKNPTELFQKGRVRSLINFSRLSKVFVVK